MRAHYFQHVSFEGLGVIEEILQDKGYQISSTRFFDKQTPPSPEEIDILIVMGGPMSVHDDAQYPWLIEEKEFIGRWIKSGKPLLGICLGAQLIASVLGASVHANRQTEIGWFPIETATSAVSSSFHFPSSCHVFHWHGETFDLPQDAVRLASSKGCDNQAFQYGNSVIGLQFHLEITPRTVATMVEKCGDELVDGQYIQPERELIGQSPQTYKDANKLMEILLKYLTER